MSIKVIKLTDKQLDFLIKNSDIIRSQVAFYNRMKKSFKGYVLKHNDSDLVTACVAIKKPVEGGCDVFFGKGTKLQNYINNIANNAYEKRLFCINIKEVSYGFIEVEANSRQEAVEIAEEMAINGQMSYNKIEYDCE